MDARGVKLGFFRRFLNRFSCTRQNYEVDIASGDCEIDVKNKVGHRGSRIKTVQECTDKSFEQGESSDIGNINISNEEKVDKSENDSLQEVVLGVGDCKNEIEERTISLHSNAIFNETFEKEEYAIQRFDYNSDTVLKGLENALEDLDELSANFESNIENSNAKIKDLETYLLSLDCTFTWKPEKAGIVCKDGQWISEDNERTGLAFIEYLTTKETEFQLVKHNFFRKFCVLLVLSYEKSLLGKLASAASDILECQKLVNTVCECDSKNSNELFVTDGRKEGIYYVLLSSIAHINYIQKFYKSALNAVSSMPKKSDLNSEARAVIHGLHAGILMEYGYRGNKAALSPVRAAINLDPDCWLWWMFLGKIIGRLRRKSEYYKPAGAEELKALRRAAELHPEAESLSHLANVYKHLHATISRQQYVPNEIEEILTKNEIESLPKIAKELYIKAASNEPNCPYNNARCAKGLTSLPVPYKDLDLAEKYMVRALHLAPNDVLVNHYAAYYYESRREFEQALASYRKSIMISGGSLSGSGTGIGNFPAELGYLSLQHRLEVGQQEWMGTSAQVGGGGVRGGRYSVIRGPGEVGCISRCSPLFQLDAMLHKYKSRDHKVQILCNKGYYLIKYEKDIMGGLQALAGAIQTDPKSATLRNFWSVFNGSSNTRICSSINVYNLMEEEIKKALEDTYYSDNHSYLGSLIELINENQDFKTDQ